MTAREQAAYIDYAVLGPDLTPEKVAELAKKGSELGCATICINPGAIALCEPIVKGTDTMLCPVTDFPFGASSTESRVQQIECAAKCAAVKEVDIVISIGRLIAGRDEEVLEDLKACAEASHRYGRELKVILETDALSEEQIRRGARLVLESGADFVKTCTGFLTGYEKRGAAVDVIGIIMDEVGEKLKIKASGGIRSREHFLALIDMGVDRCGIGFGSVPKVLGMDPD